MEFIQGTCKLKKRGHFPAIYFSLELAVYIALGTDVDTICTFPEADGRGVTIIITFRHGYNFKCVF